MENSGNPSDAAPRIAISGSSGLVGSALSRKLTSKGWSVQRLVRGQPASAADIAWDPAGQNIDTAALEGVDAVVHLAGESIAQGRWTAAKKQRILQSREEGTLLLCETLAALDHPPKTLLSASAIGYYGDQGEVTLTEQSASGEGFLAEVCRRWEAATAPAVGRDIRVVNMRLGVVLSTQGGALAKMLTPFKLGVGGVLGDGQQYMSWIALDDLLAAMEFLLADSSLSGPVNMVSPRAATNRQFTKTLGKVLGRPTVLPMPSFAARLAFGEMADEMLLASARVEPAKLTQAGFTPQWEDLEAVLTHLVQEGR
jgi:uncharacterized protein (TIGR01777 family)